MGGFYGNITNTSKTQFQFDKIYPNRYEMERQKSTDGIYAGRYVLVEYDSAYQQDDFYRVWIINDVMYNANSATNSNKILRGTSEISNDGKKLNSVPAGTIVFTADVKFSSNTGHQYTNMKYYQITEESAIGAPVSYKEIVNGLNIPNYTINYNIDISTYGAGRGYDSTVWQKAYIDGYEKYIMIAELNSVVPTFDVSADAPTMDPLVPHFDTQSTDIYYKLHWQPSWGFRIAEAQNKGHAQVTTSIDTNVGKYPTDMNVTYDKNKFNTENGKNETTKISYPGAIYFNKAGFEEDVHNEYTGSYNNEIAVTPSGTSGVYYNKHDGTSDTAIQPDIQELRIILPALGNILCSVWDRVYGYDKTNVNKRYRDVEWKDASNINNKFEGEVVPDKGQQGSEALGYMTRNPETVAGCINMTHDLLGMILTTDEITLNGVSYNANKIYYKDGKYYRIHRFPTYTKATDLSAITNLGKFDSDQEYTKAFEDAVNEVLAGHEDEDWYLVINESTSNWQVKHLNKKALTKEALQNYAIAYITRDKNGDIVYGYEAREIIGFAKDLSTVNGLILQLKQLIESDDSETRNRETVQGTINTLNDIINIFEDLIPGEFLICDDKGHVNSANWTTQQSFSYTNEGGVASNKNDFSTKENQWLDLSVDETHRLITLQHKMHNVDSTKTVSDKNDLDSGTGINKNTTKDEIALYTPIVDNMGHIIGKNTETVTLPFGYKYIQTNGISSSSVDLYTTIIPSEDGNNAENKNAFNQNRLKAQANSTQDYIDIHPINKWVQFQIDEGPQHDTISVAHEIHAINTAASATNLNTDNVISNSDNDKIILQDLEFDNAGHVTKNSQHTYTLPYGFKTIKASNTADTVVNAPASTINSNGQSAENTQDTLTISASNRWIKLDNNTEDTVKIGHKLSDLVDSAKPNTYYGLTQDESIVSLDKDNQFEVPCFKFDEAGHIIGARTHTVNLPENFDKIAVTISDVNNVNSEKGTATTEATLVEADSLSDTVTFAEGNRWINITPDANNDKLTFSHYIKQFSETTSTVDCNTNSTNNNIPIIIPNIAHKNQNHADKGIKIKGIIPIAIRINNINIRNIISPSYRMYILPYLYCFPIIAHIH